MLTLLAALLFLHFLFDYPLQGDFLAKAKNRHNPIPGVPWYAGMSAHVFMQAFAVYICTGLMFLAVLEFIVHWITDDLKCAGRLTYNQDQLIHILSKVAWAYIAYSIYPGFDQLTLV